MTTTAKVLVDAVVAANSETTQYTAPANTRTIIDKMTATNTSGSAATITVKLIPQSGAAGAANTLISAQSIAAGASYLCPEIAGHILKAGDIISTLAGTASAITIRVSGREIV